MNKKLEVFEYTVESLLEYLINNYVSSDDEGEEIFSYNTQKLLKDHKNKKVLYENEIFNTLDCCTIDKIIWRKGLNDIINDKYDQILPINQKYRILKGYKNTLQTIFLNATFRMYCDFLIDYFHYLSGDKEEYISLKVLFLDHIYYFFESFVKPIKYNDDEYIYSISHLFFQNNNENEKEYIERYKQIIHFCLFSQVLFNCGAGILLINKSNKKNKVVFMKNMSNKCNVHFKNIYDDFDEYLVQMKYYCPKIDTDGIWINQYNDTFMMI